MSLKQSKIKFKPRIKYTNFDILNSDLALRLELRKKRKKSSWSSAMNNTSSLFYSPSLGTKYKYNYIEIGLYYWKTTYITYVSGTPYVRIIATWMYVILTLNHSCILESQTAGSLQLEEKSEIQAHMIFANCELITLFYLYEMFQRKTRPSNFVTVRVSRPSSSSCVLSHN